MSKYNYKVHISFYKGDCVNVLGVRDMPYFKVGHIEKKDKVRFYKKSIQISAERKDYHNATEILHNPTLTLHQVIERAIMLYYANCTNFPQHYCPVKVGKSLFETIEI